MQLNTCDNKGPIFIMGCQRSGTSAVWRALCQHPNLSQQGPADDGRPVGTMKELWFLNEFFLGRKNNIHRPHAGSQIDEEFKKRFANLVDIFCKEKYAGPTGRWISAHPSDSLYLEDILELFPNASIIYISRHPQEVVWSSNHARWMSKMNRRQFLKKSIETAKWWRKFGEVSIKIIEGRYDSRVLFIPHDRILSKPKEIATQMLDHIGELMHTNVTLSLGQILNSSFLNNGQNSQLIQDVRHHIAKDESFCKKVIRETGDIMEKLGYNDISGNIVSPKNYYTKKNKASLIRKIIKILQENRSNFTFYTARHN